MDCFNVVANTVRVSLVGLCGLVVWLFASQNDLPDDAKGQCGRTAKHRERNRG